jgi:hypothetical protein
MALVNRILDSCVVEEEKDCLTDVKSLLVMVDDALEIASHGGQLLAEGVSRPCRVCGKGQYKQREEKQVLMGRFWADVYRCETCGHVQLFAGAQR